MTPPYHNPTADAFMRRILANPADPLPRLVFADWLDETGSSANMAWARFLRLADEVANTPADDARRPKLARELERVSGLVRAKLTYPAQVFVAYPEAMLQVLPARSMQLWLDRVEVPRAVLALVPQAVVQESLVLPLAAWASHLAVAVADSSVPAAIRTLRLVGHRDVVAFPVPPDAVRTVIERSYDWIPVETIYSIHWTDPLPPFTDLQIAHLVNMLLVEMMDAGASALEIEPGPDGVQVWHYHAPNTPPLPHDAVPRRLLVPIATRLRVLANIPAWNADTVQVGTILFPHRGQTHHLQAVLDITPDGPHVVVRPVPPPEFVAALNPAA